MYKIESILVRDPIDGFPRDKRLNGDKFVFQELKDSVLVTGNNGVINDVPKSNIVSIRKQKIKKQKEACEPTDTATVGAGKKIRVKKKCT
jgi:hypothetical protein